MVTKTVLGVMVHGSALGDFRKTNGSLRLFILDCLKVREVILEIEESVVLFLRLP